MRLFLAGATGVIGVRLIPLLVAVGHHVAGMTRSSAKTQLLGDFRDRNNRIRTEGTRNLIAAMSAAGANRLIAQSIAWRPPGGGEAVEEHERMVLDAGGVVLEYGTFYGPGTYGGDQVPDPPRIHVDEAARRTVELLDAPSGVIVVAEAQ